MSIVPACDFTFRLQRECVKETVLYYYGKSLLCLLYILLFMISNVYMRQQNDSVPLHNLKFVVLKPHVTDAQDLSVLKHSL